MSEINLYPEMNDKIAELLRLGNIEIELYAAELIEQQQKEIERLKGEQIRWISIKERLPAKIDGSLDYNELCQVTVNIGERTYVYLAYFSSCNGFSGLFGGDWNDFVIAWQPLPELFKGEEE